MKPVRAELVLAALAIAAVIAGCSNNATSPLMESVSDEGAIGGALAATPELMEEALYDNSTQTPLAAPLPGAKRSASTTTAAIDPLYFWRTILSRSVAFEYAFADTDTTGHPTTAVVTVRRHFQGMFNIAPRQPANPELPDLGNVVHKPLDDRWARRFLMRRVHVGPEDHRLWKIAASTAVDVTSMNATSVITSIGVQSAAKDTILTDPDAFIYLRNVLRFAPDETVTLTVTTPRTDDVVLLYHHDRRERFQNNGNGTYTAQLPVGTFEGWRHFGVNVLSNGTLYDDTVPYDSKAWLFPYVITGGPDVEYLP